MTLFTTALLKLRIIDGKTEVQFENGKFETEDKVEIKAVRNCLSYRDNLILEDGHLPSEQPEADTEPKDSKPKGGVANLKQNTAKKDAPSAPKAPDEATQPEAPANTATDAPEGTGDTEPKEESTDSAPKVSEPAPETQPEGTGVNP